MGGFLFGYDLSLISGAVIFLKQEFALSPFSFGAGRGRYQLASIPLAVRVCFFRLCSRGGKLLGGLLTCPYSH